jgi:hypothetical protein
MNREIKFRAWDEHQKYMAYQGSLDLETIQSFMHHFGDKPLMQFTGMHDRNGKEIYEGDIIRSEYWNPTDYKVIFEDGEFCFVSLAAIEHPYTNSIHYARDFEVIGNIYEA